MTFNGSCFANQEDLQNTVLDFLLLILIFNFTLKYHLIVKQ